jgi:DNA-binding LacI/PurR family transcriptional regulator
MDDRRKRVNIKDVARLAGVSPTTVSHALGGQRPVSEATRKRVQEAVQQLGYRPHPGARSLKASGTGVIALCAVNATSESPYANLEYYFRLMHTVTEVAHEEGYALVVVPSQNSDRYWDRVLVDGAVISDPEAADPNLAFLRGQGLPYVTIGRDPDAPDQGYWVDDDNDVETRAMLGHLLQRGARDIALVTWPTTDFWTRAGVAAYQAWCGEHGMTPRVEEVREDDDDPLEAAARRLLEGPRRPDAVYGLYELAAIAVLRRAAELGITVPEELMVAGPGDFGVAVKTTPQMTTLEYDVEGQGRAAACMLIRLLRGAPVEEPRQTVDFSIVERDSTRR